MYVQMCFSTDRLVTCSDGFVAGVRNVLATESFESIAAALQEALEDTALEHGPVVVTGMAVEGATRLRVPWGGRSGGGGETQLVGPRVPALLVRCRNQGAVEPFPVSVRRSVGCLVSWSVAWLMVFNRSKMGKLLRNWQTPFHQYFLGNQYSPRDFHIPRRNSNSLMVVKTEGICCASSDNRNLQPNQLMGDLDLPAAPQDYQSKDYNFCHPNCHLHDEQLG